MPTISRAELAALVETRAKTLAGVTIYRAEVSKTPPTISPLDPHVRPYIVLYPSTGIPGLEEDMQGRDIDLVWQFQLSCVAGYSVDAGHLVDRVTGLFEHWWPTIAGLTTNPCRQLNDSGPVRRDDTTSPARFWYPLIFSIHIGY